MGPDLVPPRKRKYARSAHLAPLRHRRARDGADARIEHGLPYVALVSQGPFAGSIPLLGVALGLVVCRPSAAFGISAPMRAAAYAFDALRIAGALYLIWLAWSAIRPGGASPFQIRDLPRDSRRKLFAMGLFTNLLNPKAAVMYMSLQPQFIHPEVGSILTQSLILGTLQISVSFTVNALLILTAGGVASFLATRRLWALIQRWIVGTVLAALAVRMALDRSR